MHYYFVPSLGFIGPEKPYWGSGQLRYFLKSRAYVCLKPFILFFFWIIEVFMSVWVEMAKFTTAPSSAGLRADR